MSVTECVTSARCHNVTNDVTRCVQRQSQTQSQSPFLLSNVALLSTQFSEPSTDGSNRASEKPMDAKADRPVPAAPPTDAYQRARKEVSR